MKRRNAECGKLRRPAKRSKLTEGLYGSTFLYLKFLLVWILVLTADFILEFRFEFLWPFWLLLRSVYDSFKFQGLAFSIFFVCIALTSDMICYLYIPVHWLFFAASTYVWVQYVWHTERGICLPTMSLWLLFVYIEASVRLREFKNSLAAFSFNMDLCRPFAAHCIGYPVVTLGFGFKSYVGYRMRQRKQREVAKENEFYMQLLQEALPPIELQEEEKFTSDSPIPTSPLSSSCNGTAHPVPSSGTSQQKRHSSSWLPSMPLWPSWSLWGSSSSSKSAKSSSKSNYSSEEQPPASANNAVKSSWRSMFSFSNQKVKNHESAISKPSETSKEKANPSPPSPKPHVQTYAPNGHKRLDSYGETDFHDLNNIKANHSINDYDEINDNILNDQHINNATSSAKIHPKQAVSVTKNNMGKKKSKQDNVSANLVNGAAATSATNDFIFRLEADIKRLKADLQGSRQSEADLRSQISALSVGEVGMKSELTQMQSDNEALQTKLHNLVTRGQSDKAILASLEKKLSEERKSRQNVEEQLKSEMIKKKNEDKAAARALALMQANQASSPRSTLADETIDSGTPCSGGCKHLKELEVTKEDLIKLRQDKSAKDDELRHIESEVAQLRQYMGETDVLKSALGAMQDKIARLENSLSAETRIKQDLFSALGESKRQFNNELMRKNQEISELKSRIAEVMALIPQPASYPAKLDSPSPGPAVNIGLGDGQYSKYLASSVAAMSGVNGANSLASLYQTSTNRMRANGVAGVPVPNGMGMVPDGFMMSQQGGPSKLDPNACIYMPKVAPPGLGNGISTTGAAVVASTANGVVSKPKISSHSQ